MPSIHLSHEAGSHPRFLKEEDTEEKRVVRFSLVYDVYRVNYV